MPSKRSTLRGEKSTPTGTSSAANASCAATRTSSAKWSSRAPTKSACKTRRSSVSKRRWRCPTMTATVLSSSSPPSGCTRTRNRSPHVSTSSHPKFALLWAVSAARSAAAKISACKCTAACWRSSQSARSKCSTAAKNHSSGIFIATPRPSSCATTPTATARYAESSHGSCSTAGRTRPRRPQCSSTQSLTCKGRTNARTRRSTATQCARTTRHAGRCVVSASFKRALPTSRRWTSSRKHAVFHLSTSV